MQLLLTFNSLSSYLLTVLCFRDYVGGAFLLLSSTRRLLLLASVGALAFFGLRVLLVAAQSTGLLASPPALLALLLVSLLALGALSSVTIQFGMLLYWFLHDRGVKRGRSWWLPFLFLSPIVSVVYYFAIYRPEVVPAQPTSGKASALAPSV